MIRSEPIRKSLGLFACCLTVGCLWLVLLPAYAERPRMKAHLQWLDSSGIDPSAMYYTELPVMEKILSRQRSKSRRSETLQDF